MAVISIIKLILISVAITNINAENPIHKAFANCKNCNKSQDYFNFALLNLKLSDYQKEPSVKKFIDTLFNAVSLIEGEKPTQSPFDYCTNVSTINKHLFEDRRDKQFSSVNKLNNDNAQGWLEEIYYNHTVNSVPKPVSDYMLYISKNIIFDSTKADIPK